MDFETECRRLTEQVTYLQTVNTQLVEEKRALEKQLRDATEDGDYWNKKYRTLITNSAVRELEFKGKTLAALEEELKRLRVMIHAKDELVRRSTARAEERERRITALEEENSELRARNDRLHDTIYAANGLDSKLGAALSQLNAARAANASQTATIAMMQQRFEQIKALA